MPASGLRCVPATYAGRVTRAHNNSNVLCLGGKTIGVFEALDILAAWLETPYDGGRHDISPGLITEAELSLMECGTWPPDGNDGYSSAR
ncbi:MAG: RpiB/LacA/LacB family sugar-phosphate isomerase [Bryobacteraceae bacterium]|nr:RpiB/LacA/LacB family sugar-phosphate isomerase [Bryobacteraceae bacterium]